MPKSILFLIFFVILNKASADESYLPPIIKYRNSNSNWERLKPILQKVKNTTNVMKESVLDVEEALNYLLAEEFEIAKHDDVQIKVDEESVMPRKVNIINKFKEAKEFLDDKHHTIDIKVLKEDVATNMTKHINNKWTKMAKSISKLEKNDCNETMSNKSDVPYNFILKQTQNENTKQNNLNIKSKQSAFTIPYHKASDILAETYISVPKGAHCDLGNLNSEHEDRKVVLEYLTHGEVVVEYENTKDTSGISYKPKKMSMMQVYESLLKKSSLSILKL